MHSTNVSWLVTLRWGRSSTAAKGGAHDVTHVPFVVLLPPGLLSGGSPETTGGLSSSPLQWVIGRRRKSAAPLAFICMLLSGCGFFAPLDTDRRPPVLVSTEVEPFDAQVAVGQTLQFDLSATYSDGVVDDDTHSAVWVSSNPDAATIETTCAPSQVPPLGGCPAPAFNPRAGLATGKSPGKTTIRGSTPDSRGLLKFQAGGTATLTVTATDFSLSISPAIQSVPQNGSISYTVTINPINNFSGHVTLFMAFAGLVGGSATVSPSSIDFPATSSATVTFTTAFTTNPGTIDFAVEGRSVVDVQGTPFTLDHTSNNAKLTVTKVQAPLQSISIVPSGQSIFAGSTLQFTAMGTYADRTTSDITSAATWASGDPTVASLESAGSPNPGLGTAVKVGGPVNVTATLGNITGSTTLSVLVSLPGGPIGAAELVDAPIQPCPGCIGGFSDKPATNQDGSYIVFHSEAGNLIPGISAGTGSDQIYVRHTCRAMLTNCTGSTTLVSAGPGGQRANGLNGTLTPAISANGRFIAFDSTATNLVTAPTPTGFDEIYVLDRDASGSGTFDTPGNTLLTLVSIDNTGRLNDGDILTGVSISGNGRYVAFTSSGSSTSGGAGVFPSQVYIRDTCAGAPSGCRPRTTLGSVDFNGNPFGGAFLSFDSPALDFDGRFVAFTLINQVVVGPQVQLYNRDVSGTGVFDTPGNISTSTVSADQTGNFADGPSGTPAISGDGRYVAFSSEAPNLTSDAVPQGVRQAYLRDTVAGKTILVSTDGGGNAGNGASPSTLGSDPRISMSSDGRVVAFSSDAFNFYGGDNNLTADVFIRDTCIFGTLPGCAPSTRITSISLATGLIGDRSSGTVRGPSVSGDGRFVALDSFATDLVLPKAPVNQDDIYLALTGIQGPSLTSITPNNGNPNSPVPVTISGTEFASPFTINIGASCAGFLSAGNPQLQNSTTITATLVIAANASAGPCPISVTVPGGTTNTKAFSVNSLTTIFAVTALQLNPITVIGGQENSTGTVTINGAAPQPTGLNVALSSSDSSVSVPAMLNIPAGATTNTFTASTNTVATTIPVTVKASLGLTSQTVTLTVNPGPVNNPLPAITALNPPAVVADSGDLVLTITGTNFVAGAQVIFGSANLAPVSITSVQIVVTIPGNFLDTGGPAPVIVHNPGPGGGNSNSVNLNVTNPVPQITSMSPAAVSPGSGGFTLTINGSNFVTQSKVNFGNTVLPINPSSTVTQIFVNIAANFLVSAGTVNVTVTNPAPVGGTSNTAVFSITPVSFTQGPILTPGNIPSIDSTGNTIVAANSSAAFVFVKDGTGNWTQATELDNPDNAALSTSISGDGTTIVVGSCQNNVCLGHAFVYVQPVGGWSSAARMNPTATLSASDAAVRDRIGYSVSIDQNGDTVAFGAPCDYTAGALRCGSVYVFLKGNGWPATKTQDAKLTVQIPGTSSVVATLGFSVSMDLAGDTIVAGAIGVEALANLPGAVYVFLKPTSGTWTDSTSANATLTASDGINNDLLGYSASISGDGTMVVAGAPNNPTNTASNNASGPGAAYVFLRPSGGWNGTKNQDSKLMASAGQNHDLFGGSVATSHNGGTVVVGARFNPASTQGPGAVYVFDELAGGWIGSQIETLRLSASAGTDIHGNSVTPTGGFGMSVSINANGATIASGGFATVGANSSQGAVYVF